MGKERRGGRERREGEGNLPLGSPAAAEWPWEWGTHRMGTARTEALVPIAKSLIQAPASLGRVGPKRTQANLLPGALAGKGSLGSAGTTQQPSRPEMMHDLARPPASSATLPGKSIPVLLWAQPMQATGTPRTARPRAAPEVPTRLGLGVGSGQWEERKPLGGKEPEGAWLISSVDWYSSGGRWQVRDLPRDPTTLVYLT